MISDGTDESNVAENENVAVIELIDISSIAFFILVTFLVAHAKHKSTKLTLKASSHSLIH